MRTFPVVPGVPAAGHVTSGGHWHPGADRNCQKCRQPERVAPPSTALRNLAASMNDVVEAAERFIEIGGGQCSCDPATMAAPCAYCTLIDEVDRVQGRRSRREVNHG